MYHAPELGVGTHRERSGEQLAALAPLCHEAADRLSSERVQLAGSGLHILLEPVQLIDLQGRGCGIGHRFRIWFKVLEFRDLLCGWPLNFWRFAPHTTVGHLGDHQLQHGLLAGGCRPRHSVYAVQYSTVQTGRTSLCWHSIYKSVSPERGISCPHHPVDHPGEETKRF